MDIEMRDESNPSEEMEELKNTIREVNRNIDKINGTIDDIDKRIVAIEIVIGSFVDYSNEEQRKASLRDRFQTNQFVKVYLCFDYNSLRLEDDRSLLQNRMIKLEDERNLLQNRIIKLEDRIMELDDERRQLQVRTNKQQPLPSLEKGKSVSL